MGNSLCRYCGATILDGQKFCVNCGRKTEPVLPRTPKFCAGCGAALTAGGKFCPDCGYPIVSPTSDTAESPAPNDIPTPAGTSTPVVVPIPAVPIDTDEDIFSPPVPAESAPSTPAAEQLRTMIEEAQNESDGKDDTEEKETSLPDATLKALICPSCGSHDVAVEGEQGVCRFCGVQFALLKKVPPVHQEIHIHHNGNGAESSPMICQKIQTAFTPQEFLRKVLIEMAIDDSPLDIYDAVFSPIAVCTRSVYLQRQTAVLAYTAVSGVDREETYEEDKDYYNKDTGRYEKQRVTKTRTVTDWTPLSGTHTVEGIGFSFNDNREITAEQLRLFGNSYDSVPDSALSPLPSNAVTVKDSAREKSADMLQENQEIALKDALPGDHLKDVRFSVQKIEKNSEECSVMQEYAVAFPYRGVKYHKWAFPFGNMQIGGNETHGAKEEIFGMLWKKTAVLSVLALAAIVISLIVSLAVRVLPVQILAAVLMIALFTAKEIITHNTRKKLSEIYLRQKTAALQEKLEALNLPELTETEIAAIRSQTDASRSDFSQLAHDLDGYTTIKRNAHIYLWVTFFLLAITAVITAALGSIGWMICLFAVGILLLIVGFEILSRREKRFYQKHQAEIDKYGRQHRD